jgi:Rrf2 family iron-sulfur cluster assembly transcriptional regulator
MGILFSRQCEYALQAVTYMARKPDGAKTPICELARTLKIPHHFLAKILQRLTQKGLLVSTKGAAGGFGIGLHANDFTPFHIVDAIDGAGFANNCVLGFPQCSGDHPCAVHEHWGRIRDEMYQMLVGRSISEVGDAMKKPGYEKIAR